LRSPFFSASCAFEKSCCALPLISSSPGARYLAFSPGLKITEPTAWPVEAHQIRAGKIRMRKQHFIALRRVATLPAQSSWARQDKPASPVPLQRCSYNSVTVVVRIENPKSEATPTKVASTRRLSVSPNLQEGIFETARVPE